MTLKLRIATLIYLSTATGSLAYADNDCADLFKSHALVSTQNESLVKLIDRFLFSELGPDAKFSSVVQNSNGSLAAVTTLRGKTTKLFVISLRSGETIATEDFEGGVTRVHFIEGSSFVLVNGSKISSSNDAKAYLINLNPAEQKRLPLGQQNHETNQLAIPWWKADAQLLVQNLSLSHFSQPSRESHLTLDLPGSIYWGSRVNQVIAREDLPYVFVVQNAWNQAPTVAGDGQAERYNKSTTLFDPSTTARIRSLDYDGFVPSEISLNPKNTRVAMKVISPMKGNRVSKIIIADANQIDKVIYQHDLVESTITSPTDKKLSIPRSLESSWSPDGNQIAIVETATGSIVIRDLKARKNIFTEIRKPYERWPILAAKFLSSGNLLVFRQGPSEAGLVPTAKIPKSIFAEVVDPSALNLDRARFEIRISLDKNLFQLFEDGVGEVSLYEMNNGKTVAIVMDGQIVLVDARDPSRQTVVSPIPNGHRDMAPLVISAVKVSETSLRISTNQGIYDIQLPNF